MRLKRLSISKQQLAQLRDLAIAMGIAFVMLFPLLWMLTGSFKAQTEVFQVPPTILPREFSLEGYRMLFQMTNFVVFFRNSFVVSIAASSIAVLLSIGGVYGVTRFRFLGAQAFTYLTLLIYMLPPVLLVIPLYTLWIRAGLADTLLSLSLSYVALTLPFALWMSRSYIGTIPIEIEEAAMVDGASRFEAFLRVTLPQAVPGLITTLIFTFILAWNEYIIALVLISSEQNKTVSLGVANLIGETAMFSWPMLNAAGVLATLPILVLFAFVQRRMVSGLSVGALTGQ
jgi:multiple sugar transport system permease protein